MDAYLSNNRNRAINFERPPVLIAADNDRAIVRARATVASAGFRISDAVGIEIASDRLDRQAAASALWLEFDASLKDSANALLDRAAASVREGRFGAVVAIPGDLIDDVGPHLFAEGVEVIVDADDAGRAAALAVATSGTAQSFRIADVTADKNAARLRQLSDEVSRIASTLARLSTGPNAVARPPEADVTGDALDVSIETVRTVIRARRLRGRYFSEELFADPAWDMLLDLLQSELTRLRVPVSSLCIAAAVPATTALRWLKTMVQEGLFLRQADPHDGRRVFVELAPQTSHALRRYFNDVGRVGVV